MATRQSRWGRYGTGRCKETETRFIPKDAHTRIRTVPRTVQCSEAEGHDPEVTPHAWSGLPFGRAQRGTRA